MEGSEKDVRIYRRQDGHIPYLEWLEGLRDRQAKQRIQARIGRLRIGNFGHTRSVGEGVQELKVDYGPGYRVYFGQDGQRLVIILCGGDKGTQDEDIKKAKKYWASYRKEKNDADN